MKIAYNASYGGFSLSNVAMARVRELGMELDEFEHSFSSLRSHPILISVIEEMGGRANGVGADIQIVDIPDDVQWTIQEYDGLEWVAEKHRTWSVLSQEM